MKIYSFTFARKGSKGLKNKNLKKIKNKTLVNIAITHAKRSKYISKIFLSTDCPNIAKEGIHAGASVPFYRPQSLAHDKSPEWLSWQHSLNFLKKNKDFPDIFVSIPCTSPLRKVKDIDKMILKLMKNRKLDALVAVTKSHRNPYFNMISLSNKLKANITLKSKRRIFRRQDCPAVFDLTTIAFVVRARFILKAKHLFAGNVQGYVVDKKTAIDIDDEIDLKIAKNLANEL